MTLLAAPHSPGGTPHSAAAARISMSRAAAPPLRTYSCELADAAAAAGREIAPDALARRVLAGGRKFGRDPGPVAFQLLGDELCSPVSVPWPISERAIRITTVSSGRIDDPGVDLRCRPGRRGLGRGGGIERHAEPERQAAAERRRRRETSGGRAERCGHRVISSHRVRLPVTPWRRRGSPRAPADRCRSGRCS